MTELTQLYRSFFQQEPARVQQLSGSASHRCYYRLFHSTDPDSGSVIGVIGESRAENHAFLSLARHMLAQGLNVPRVFCASDDEMRYLQQDLGDLSLYDLLQQERKQEPGGAVALSVTILRQVMRELPRLQFLTAHDFDFTSHCCRESRFGGQTIRWDLNYFKYCFLKLTGCPIDEMRLDADFEKLTTALLDCKAEDEKWAFLYRDFQSRNIMLDASMSAEGTLSPYFIDFQGGYLGPVYYDVASFLWQTRAAYDPELRNELLSEYVDALQEFQPMSLRVFRHRLRVFVFFRLLQTLGTYGYRGLFEHKAMFQTPITQALQALVRITQRDSEPAFRRCSLRPGADTIESGAFTIQSIFGDAFLDGNWGPDDSAGCNVGDDGFTDETTPAIDRFEIEEDCPYLCQLLAQVAQMERFQPQPTTGPLTVRITSFSYKRGIPEDYSGNGGGFVFDCRAPLNPGRFPFYKQQTGLDAAVIDFLEGRRDEQGNPCQAATAPTSMQTFVANAMALVSPAVQTYLDRGFTSLFIACGCTGGQHRSVYCAQHLAEQLHALYPAARIILTHREQQIITQF